MCRCVIYILNKNEYNVIRQNTLIGYITYKKTKMNITADKSYYYKRWHHLTVFLLKKFSSSSSWVIKTKNVIFLLDTRVSVGCYYSSCSVSELDSLFVLDSLNRKRNLLIYSHSHLSLRVYLRYTRLVFLNFTIF